MQKILTAEYMLSDTNGLGLRRNWFPRIVAEAFLESTKDGDIKRSPDPVTMIDGDLTWFNNSPDDQIVQVIVHRAPRTIVSTSPATVIIIDAYSFLTGKSPEADFPSLEQNWFGGKTQLDRPEVAADKLAFGHYFLDQDDCQEYVDVGLVKSMEAMHFRYTAAVQTPGVWTQPTQDPARYEAHARWCRLIALGAPVGG